MRALDKTKVYDLSELTSEEKGVLLKHLQNTSKNGWTDINNFKNKRLAYFTEFDNNGEWLTTTKPSTTNAKELFYTLENVQVDCSELSEEQVKEMADVCENLGYKPFHSSIKTNLNVERQYLYFKLHENKYTVGINNDLKTTITYSKFMELFAESIQPQFLQKAIGEGDKNCYYFHHSEKHGPNFYTKEEIPFHDGEDWKEDLVVYTQLGSGKKFVTTKERFKKFKKVWI